MTKQINRRTMLQLSGAATVAATAGCGDILGGDGSSAGYSQYLSTSDDQVFFVYANFEGLEEFEDEEDGASGEEDLDVENPMLAPVGGLILLGFAAGFRLGAAGIGGLIDTEAESDLDSQADELLLSNNVTVVVGDIDTDEIDERITTTSEDAFAATGYEEVEEADGFTFYQATDDSEEAMAVSGDELFAAEDRDSIEDVIAATDGDGRAEDEFDEFAWLLDTAGDGLLAMGGYGPDGFEGLGEEGSNQEEEESADELDELGDDGGFVASLDFDGDDVNSTLAASVDELSEDQQAELENELQSGDADVSVEFDGGRVTAEATYSKDDLNQAA